MIDRALTSTEPEDIFTELFSQVFGPEKTLLISPQHPVTDVYGVTRYVDMAIKTSGTRIALEIDGLAWHQPDLIPIEKFEDDLLRQNSLVFQNWRVFRWTDRQIIQEPEKVKEQLALFLENLPGFLPFDDFLPRQTGEIIDLREHQNEALKSLERIRAENKSIALLEHPTGSGKTVTAIEDARRLGGRTLWLVHRRDLIIQTQVEFQKFWPEVITGRYFGGEHEKTAHNIIASIQSVSENLNEFHTNEFDYLIIDEAHHAAANTYKRVLEYFKPKFILGMTATAERADGRDLLELFRDSAHRLSLQQAVERGELVPIRCVRVMTNIDLSRVRYNQLQYNRRDIEEAITIPARDKLIVDTYIKHVMNRKAVAFAVNIRHGESLAEEFRKAGVSAKSISGRMPIKERETILLDFQEGKTRVLCACDILNEGWNCPDIEVLLMARPTLSRVLYLQQLGRGTRKAEGKDCLFVFDFVDNANRYNQSLSAHRVLGRNSYRPGGLLLAPEALMSSEEQSINQGKIPNVILEIGLWVKDFQPIDIFNWQETCASMISIVELERELAVSQGRVRNAIERQQINSDHEIQIGDRTYYWFHKDRIEEIRLAIGAPKLEESTIRERFIQFVTEMDMSLSYKPVMLISLLDRVNDNGVASTDEVAKAFLSFYQNRKVKGLVVERKGSRKVPIEDLEKNEIKILMLGMPFEKFERRRFLKYDHDRAYIRFEKKLWQSLTPDDIKTIKTKCELSIEKYYERIQTK